MTMIDLQRWRYQSTLESRGDGVIEELLRKLMLHQNENSSTKGKLPIEMEVSASRAGTTASRTGITGRRYYLHYSRFSGSSGLLPVVQRSVLFFAIWRTSGPK